MEATMTFIRRMHIPYEHRYFQLVVGFLLICMLALPISRQLLESSLIHHMLIQIPLLALAGWMMGKSLLKSRFKDKNKGGIPGLLIALFAIFFWMIPRWLDAALSEPLWEVIKFISVPLLIGAPLSISWPKMSSFSRGVVWTNAISMFGVLGWLYVAAPIRVCNNYLVNQQEDFGYTAMALGIALAVYWVGVAFFGNWDQEE